MNILGYSKFWAKKIQNKEKIGKNFIPSDILKQKKKKSNLVKVQNLRNS